MSGRRASDRLIVALDASTLSETARLARRLQGLIRYVKIGSITFTASGPAVIQRVRALGFDVLLDLKFHDIPSTVEKSCRAAVRHRVWMLTVHASGQREMLEAAVAGAAEEARRLKISRPKIVGVTVLTSVESGRPGQVVRRVVELAREAQTAGLDGVVASAQEAPAIRRHLGPRLGIVCPGIRPAGVEVCDQQRVSTPRQALASGADWLVVGRPITGAPDPRAAARQILAEMEDRHGVNQR